MMKLINKRKSAGGFGLKQGRVEKGYFTLL